MKRNFLMAAVFVLTFAVAAFVVESPASLQAAPDLGLMFASPLAPPNDNFSDATAIPGLPFETYVQTAAATTEWGEPTPSCVYPDYGETVGNTLWYYFTPTESATLVGNSYWYPSNTFLAVYTGETLEGLSEMACGRFYYSGTVFKADAGTRYYIQIGGLSGYTAEFPFSLNLAPLPQANFYYNPWEPSVLDTIAFDDSSWDPIYIGLESSTWDFGDGTTAVGFSASHKYAADGDYMVHHSVTTLDGRTGSTSQSVRVRTQDVSITKFSTPQSAKAGQTRPISVGVANKWNETYVRVTLYKSMPYGFEQIGMLDQFVFARSGNRTTEFSFNYTFTSDDASVGKATFKAVVWPLEGRDAWPADNEAISSPTKVSP